MTDVEDLVRATLAEHAHDVDGVVVTFVPSRPSRARWVAVAALGAVAAAVVAVLVAVSPESTSTRPRPAAPPPQPGMQAVSYHGITIDVPSSWPVGTYYCENPPTSAVMVESGPAPSCPAVSRPSRDPQAMVVHLGSYAAVAGGEPPVGSVSTLDVDGRKAVRVATDRAATDDVPAGREVDLTLDDPGVFIGIDAPTDASADVVLATVRITPVDTNGCVDHIPAAIVSTNPPATSLLPSPPISIVACEYGSEDQDGSLWVTGSGALDAAAVTAFVSRVTSARPWTPSTQVDEYWGVSAARYVVTFRDGSTRTIDTRPDHEQLRISDGHTDVALDAGPGLPGPYDR